MSGPLPNTFDKRNPKSNKIDLYLKLRGSCYENMEILSMFYVMKKNMTFEENKNQLAINPCYF